MSALANEYAYATECNLATLGELCMLKSSSKARIDRQKSICAHMLGVCRQCHDEIDWAGAALLFGGRRPSTPRVREMLQAACEACGDIALALDRYCATILEAP